MPHENLFFVEKHYNDSLHNPKRAGTTHTDKEIQAAANLLGRDSVAVEERHIKKAGKKKRDRERVDRILSEGEAVGDGVVILGAAATGYAPTAIATTTSAAGVDAVDGGGDDAGGDDVDSATEAGLIAGFGKRKKRDRDGWDGVVGLYSTSSRSFESARFQPLNLKVCSPGFKVCFQMGKLVPLRRGDAHRHHGAERREAGRRGGRTTSGVGDGIGGRR
jgi:hypothetical protein